MINHRYICRLIWLSLPIFSGELLAAANIEVMALFKDKAMIMIDNDQYLLKAGEPGKLGVQLIKATSKYAVLEIDGKQSKYLLGNRVQSNYGAAREKEISCLQRW